VLGGQLAAAAARRADDQWTAGLATEHVVDLGGVVDDLVHRQQAEVDRHDLHDRPRAGHRRADRRADEALLGDRRVAHALLAELLQQALGDAVGPVEHPDLLAQDEHPVIAGQLLAQREPQRLADGHAFTRWPSPYGAPGPMRANCSSLPESPYRCSSRLSRAGSGLFSANSTAARTRFCAWSR